MSLTLIVALSVVGLTALAIVIWRRPVLVATQRSAAFTQAVRGEVRKITWPTWDDLRRSTGVITILVIVIGVIIGIMDRVFSLVLIEFFGKVFG